MWTLFINTGFKFVEKKWAQNSIFVSFFFRQQTSKWFIHIQNEFREQFFFCYFYEYWWIACNQPFQVSNNLFFLIFLDMKWKNDETIILRVLFKWKLNIDLSCKVNYYKHCRSRDTTSSEFIRKTPKPHEPSNQRNKIKKNWNFNQV